VAAIGVPENEVFCGHCPAFYRIAAF